MSDIVSEGRRLFDRIFPHPELPAFVHVDGFGDDECEDDILGYYEEYENMVEDHLIHTSADAIHAHPFVSDFRVIDVWEFDLWDYERVRFVVDGVDYTIERRFHIDHLASEGELLYETFKVVK